MRRDLVAETVEPDVALLGRSSITTAGPAVAKHGQRAGACPVCRVPSTRGLGRIGANGQDIPV